MRETEKQSSRDGISPHPRLRFLRFYSNGEPPSFSSSLSFPFHFLSIHFNTHTLDQKNKKTMPSFIGAIDNGTTSSRFLIFDENGNLVIGHQLEYRQIFPHPG